MKHHFVFLVLILVSCNENNRVSEEAEITMHKKNDSSVTTDPEKKSGYNFQITENDTMGFGYEIYLGEKLYIRQPVIPAIQGNHAFKSEEDAKKVATLMLQKLERGINPPTVSKEELDNLGIIQ